MKYYIAEKDTWFLLIHYFCCVAGCSDGRELSVDRFPHQTSTVDSTDFFSISQSPAQPCHALQQSCLGVGVR